MRFRQILSALGYALFLCSQVHAEVVRVEITSRLDLGESGYEEIVGRLHFEVDPARPCNAVIADIGLAPVNADGRVAFSSDLRILKPRDPARANGAAWVEIPNRGNRAQLSPWMTRNGFTVLNVGWEFDVARKDSLLRIQVPAARNHDGSAIRGVVSATFTPDQAVDRFTVTDLTEYPPVDATGPETRLVKRAQMAYPAGAEVPREYWSLEGNQVRLQGGFEPGATYEVFYLAEGPPVAGLGYAAIRDAVAWLRHDTQSLAPVKHAYAFGVSQCGRFLRDFIYLGFNTDERERQVLDGMISHVAGAGRLVLNRRWATPRSLAEFCTTAYPFTDLALPDPVSGQTDGLIENPRVKHPPKIFHTNSSTEYWGAGRVAALIHTDPAGTRDIPLAENVRCYYFAGTQHGGAKFPPTSLTEGSPLSNPTNPIPVVEALRVAMHRWVSDGIEPPASRYPRLSDGTLVPVAQARFPLVPGMALPQALRAGPRIANPRWPGGAGAGVEMPLLVPQVDADGNELAGIRLPGIAAPLGTATGWVFRPPAFGSPHELVLLRGAWIPFATTRAKRDGTEDPRPSLEERYPSKDAYLKKVGDALAELVHDRFLANSETDQLLTKAAEMWDWLHRQ